MVTIPLFFNFLFIWKVNYYAKTWKIFLILFRQAKP